ncbi:MAG: carboxymuconolactone decarboxylase family protein [Pseudomonadota bacterium]
MNPSTDTPQKAGSIVTQGFSPQAADRLPMMPRESMTPAQRQAADELIAGPRKAVFGPFIPLLRSPELMGRVGKLGEYLRFDSVLDVRVRELATCIAARHTSNQFEWLMHVPAARKAGVAQATLDAIAEGRHPAGMAADEAAAANVALEVLRHHGLSDATWAEALGVFGEQGVVELVALVGYFVMVCWVMNVARTDTHNAGGATPLAAFPV